MEVQESPKYNLGITVGSLMTTALCLERSDTIKLAARMMIGRDLGFIPVVSDHDKCHLIGVVTDRDIMAHVASHVDMKELDFLNFPVSSIMTSNVYTVCPEDDLGVAIEIMVQNQIRRIVVVKDGKVVGVLSVADLAQQLDDRTLVGEIIAAITTPKKISGE